MTTASVFYAYLHAKPDTSDAFGVFYVGKGKGKRAYEFKREKQNPHYARIVKKYGIPQVSKIECSSEQNAFDLEKGLIKCLRRMGVALTNLTDGGEGVSGWKPSDNWRWKKSQELKKKGREAVANGTHIFLANSEKRKEIDRKNKLKLHQRLIEQDHHFFTNHPMRNPEIAKIVGGKVSVKLRGRWCVKNVNSGEQRLLPKEEAISLLMSPDWVRGRKNGSEGNTNVRGKVWVCNSQMKLRKMVNVDQLDDLLRAGWMRGKKL